MPKTLQVSEVEARLDATTQKTADWKLWGPYVSERAWGTVREDYSRDGSAWEYFPFAHAGVKAYRWNEDGIAGICDRQQRLCFALALWNGKDPFLKERYFGLTGNEGNHGEDVKEYYFYLDSTPTHCYMKALYKYPQAAFPYDKLRTENARRNKSDAEYELLDTGVFDDDRYFDVFIEYAKETPEDICIRITAFNRGPEAAPLHLLPTAWFRNTWVWTDESKRPEMKIGTDGAIEIDQDGLGEYKLYAAGKPALLFCENETNFEKLYGVANRSEYTRDGINNFVVEGDKNAVNPDRLGTKAAAHYALDIPAGGSETVYLRLVGSNRGGAETRRKKEEETRRRGVEVGSGEKTDTGRQPGSGAPFIEECEAVFTTRIAEAGEFYAGIIPENASADERNVMRQSLAGMLWSKQFYHYDVQDWLEGDPAFPLPPKERLSGRNSAWKHLNNADIISMPDKWEYPWYAAWDLAFHCIPLAIVDPGFAKRQLILLLREWYMHPNGQIPAYEWAFGDVNPPVHAWAALRVFRIEAKRTGKRDRAFLEKVFHKLLLNFTWWVNRKDEEGNNVFEGGFLGLDNIGVFDRNTKLPDGGHLEQSDGTSWMAMYCLNMLAIALELAREDKVYEDVASKFFEHFVYISDALNNMGEDNAELWNEEDGFYYDVLHAEGRRTPIKLRSMVGLCPLFAVETVDENWLDILPDFRRRTEWFLKNRPDLTESISCLQNPGQNNRRLLAVVTEDKLRRVLTTMLSEEEFLSDNGIRALSRHYRDNPYEIEIGGQRHRVEYEPGESRSGMFGGNSNWRGPVWFPANYLLIEALQKFDYFYGDTFRIEFPTGSGNLMTLWEVTQALERRLTRIFLQDENGARPVYGEAEKFQKDPHWRDHLLFYEYFHGDTGSGLGASHQTGWTGLIGKILQQVGEYSEDGKRGTKSGDSLLNFRVDD
jgi:hypothetical protein